MSGGTNSFTRYFIILLIVFLVSVYLIYDFKNTYQSDFTFGAEKVEF